MQTQIDSPASLRQKALNFLQREQRLSTDINNQNSFKPYFQERTQLGGLIGSAKQSFFVPIHKLKISLVVKPSDQSVLVKGKNTLFFAKGKQRRQQQLNFHKTQSIAQFLPSQSQMIENNFMRQLEQTSQTNMIKKKKHGSLLKKMRISILGTTNEKPPVFSLDKWKVSVIDKDENKDAQKSSPKRDRTSKLVSNKTQEYPGIGQYSPDWEKVLIYRKKTHPKLTPNVFITKTDRGASYKIEKKIPIQALLSVSQKTPFLEESYHHMYANLQSQVQREVNLSLKLSPQSQHPYSLFSVKPLDDRFIEQGKTSVNAKLAESRRMKQRLTQELQ